MAGAALAAACDLAAAALLHRAATGGLRQSTPQARGMALAFLCASAAAQLASAASPGACLSNALLLGALAAALTSGGAQLSTVLLATGTADWIPGAVLLVVPLALLAARTAAGKGSTTSQPLWKPLAAYAGLLAAALAALVHLRSLLPPRWAELLGSWQAALPPGQPPSPSDPLAWVGARAAQQPPFQPPAPLLPAASLQPGLNLYWYLMAQAFPRFRPFFLFVLQALPAATALPLALRFPQRPELLLAAGTLLRCILHPRAQPAMAALWIALLPLARRHMASNAALPWLTLGLGAALLLAESAQQLWLSGAGNANFLYGITLLWAGLQVVLLLQLLRAAARAEAAPVPAADAAAGAEEEQQLQKRGASEPGSSGKQD